MDQREASKKMTSNNHDAGMRNWKLIHDPVLKKGLQPLFRHDGLVASNSAYNVLHVSDPRSLKPRFLSRNEHMHLPVPCFTIDDNYVGKPALRELTFFDLNDNVSESFLTELCKKSGELDEVKIYFHPVTKRHLGVGRVVFKSVRAASNCVEKYDSTAIMGKTVKVFRDPWGKSAKELIARLTTATTTTTTATTTAASTSTTNSRPTVTGEQTSTKNEEKNASSTPATSAASTQQPLTVQESVGIVQTAIPSQNGLPPPAYAGIPDDPSCVNTAFPPPLPPPPPPPPPPAAMDVPSMPAYHQAYATYAQYQQRPYGQPAMPAWPPPPIAGWPNGVAWPAWPMPPMMNYPPAPLPSSAQATGFTKQDDSSKTDKRSRPSNDADRQRRSPSTERDGRRRDERRWKTPERRRSPRDGRRYRPDNRSPDDSSKFGRRSQAKASDSTWKSNDVGRRSVDDQESDRDFKHGARGYNNRLSDDDEQNKSTKRLKEPVVEKVEEKYYRRKKLGFPPSKTQLADGKASSSGGEKSRGYIDEIEEYHFRRKRLQRVRTSPSSEDRVLSSALKKRVSSTDRDTSRPLQEKFEAITSSEDENNKKNSSDSDDRENGLADMISPLGKLEQISGSDGDFEEKSSTAAHRRREGNRRLHRRDLNAANSSKGRSYPSSSSESESEAKRRGSRGRVTPKCRDHEQQLSNGRRDEGHRDADQRVEKEPQPSVAFSQSLEKRIEQLLGTAAENSRLSVASTPVLDEDSRLEAKQPSTKDSDVEMSLSSGEDEQETTSPEKEIQVCSSVGPEHAQQFNASVYWSQMYMYPPMPPAVGAGGIELPPTAYPPFVWHPGMVCPPMANFRPNQHAPPAEKPNAGFTNEQLASNLTRRSVSEVVKDLKQVLHKDILKRAVEATLFKCVDSWYNSEEKRYHMKKTRNEPEVKKPMAPTSAKESQVAEVTISKLFDSRSNTDLTSLTGVPGLGLRACLPKLPSFKKKVVRPPTPPSPSRASYDSSDSEAEERQRRKRSSASPKLSHRRRLIKSSSSSRVSRSSLSSKAGSSSDESTQSSSEGSDRATTSNEASVDASDSSEYDSDSESETEKLKPELISSASSGNESEKEDLSVRQSNAEPKTIDKPAVILEQRNGIIDSDSSNCSHSAVDNCNKDTVENTVSMPSDIPKRQGTVQIDDDYMIVDDGQSYEPSLFDHCYATTSQTGAQTLPNHTIPSNTSVLKPTQSKTTDVVVDRRKKTELDKVPPPSVASVVFKPRDKISEQSIVYEFLKAGIDEEDIKFLKSAYDSMVTQQEYSFLSRVSWVPHIATAEPPYKKRRLAADEVERHATGSARTEGFYRLSHKEKQRTTAARLRQASDPAPPVQQQQQQKVNVAKQQVQFSREARSMQRRLLTTLGSDAADSELFKFNQLKFRKKLIKFSRSNIHGWGLFAMEDIAQDEMIVEYVGQKIRLTVAERREQKYEKMGVGSSYLFRIDTEMVVDATKRGNIARFINHSCNPNCYARIITVDGEKRIVIYSKQPIFRGEEITYDYKFPLEDEKIPCHCGAPACRGSLN